MAGWMLWSALAAFLAPTAMPPPAAKLQPPPPPPPAARRLRSRPNILLIVADDLGWNDVGWNNPHMKTPHLSRLATYGVIMNYSYVAPVCSPSRAALLTGRYPFKLGMHSRVFRPNKPEGLPLEYTLLPEKLKQAGYATHIVGKWHLGFCKWEYTPTYRGFDTFLGFYTGAQDYYTHTTVKPRGYDFRANTSVLKQPKQYSTFTFSRRAVELINTHERTRPLFIYLPFQAVHSPIQVPKKYEAMYSHIKNKKRRAYSGMVTAMDKAVGRIVYALTQRKMIKNTLIIFLSDNGGSPYASAGNNWPLRGGKSTLWEGGTRVPTFVWGKMLKRKRYVNNELIHAVDWFPTILQAAGITHDSKIDGVSQWKTIRKGARSIRKEFVYGINGNACRSALRFRGFKLIEGNAGRYNERYHPKRRHRKLHGNQINYRHLNRTMLFDIDADPTESLDVTLRYPGIVKLMRRRLAKYRAKLAPAKKHRKIRMSNPKFWEHTWSPGWC